MCDIDAYTRYVADRRRVRSGYTAVKLLQIAPNSQTVYNCKRIYARTESQAGQIDCRMWIPGCACDESHRSASGFYEQVQIGSICTKVMPMSNQSPTMVDVDTASR